MRITLPAPCPICEGPVTYAGRGRRPDYCSTACKNVQRAEDARNRRARERGEVAPVDPLLKALAERRAQRIATQPRVEVWKAADDHLPDVAELAAEVRGEGQPFSLANSQFLDEDESRGSWADRTAIPHDDDPAARWVAENAPHALADFPRAHRVGRTLA